MEALFLKIKEYHKWADRQENKTGEWDSWYPDWDNIRTLFDQFLRTSDYRDWNREQIDEILYIIARDNELEGLADRVTEDEPLLLFLAEKALSYPDPDTRWQMAVYLPCCERKADAERLLVGYVQDEHEYVNRRALMALAEVQSKETENYCKIAWERDCYGELQEYQRIAVLHAVSVCKSGLLPDYIRLAKEDGRKWLVENALEIEASYKTAE